MGHLHSVYDTDNHFKVNGITRVITDVSKSKTSVVQYDHNSERFTFEIPRYIEGHDMATCNSVSVRYQNGSPKDGINKGKYIVGDFQISPADENVVICSWLISKKATQYAGALKFYLRLECITEKEPDYVWSTSMYTGITVQPSFDDFDVVEDGDYVEYPDDDSGTAADYEVAFLGVASLGTMILGAGG